VALWSRGHLVGLGLVVLGLLLLAGLAGARAGRRARPGARAVQVALLAGGVGLLLVVAGTAVALATEPDTLVAYSGSYQPLGCPGWPVCGDVPERTVVDAGRLTGLGVAVLGAMLLAAVAGRWQAAGRRVDQV
jgi:hypothetical protein